MRPIILGQVFVVFYLAINSVVATSSELDWKQSTEGSAFPSKSSPADTTEQWSSIVNGTITSQYPAVGALIRKRADGLPSGLGHCTATLVGCSHILTAAHCLPSKDPKSYVAWFQSTGFIEVKDVSSQHPTFKHCSGGAICSTGDIALVELQTPVVGIQTSPITRSTMVPGGDQGTIVGYGISQGDAMDYGIKRRGAVTASTCAQDLAGERDSAWLCWKYSSRLASNTCSGDSGGPLFASNGAIGGVTSTGLKRDCSSGDLAFDTRVSAYSAWLTSVAPGKIEKQNCGAGPQAGGAGAPMLMVVNDKYVPDGTGTRHRLSIPAGVTKLVLSLQAVGRDFRLVDAISIQLRSTSSGTTERCQVRKFMNFAACTVATPELGEWDALVQVHSTAGKDDKPFIYQLVATLYLN